MFYDRKKESLVHPNKEVVELSKCLFYKLLIMFFEKDGHLREVHWRVVNVDGILVLNEIRTLTRIVNRMSTILSIFSVSKGK